MNVQEPLEAVRSFWIFLSFFYLIFSLFFGAFGEWEFHVCLWVIIIIKNEKLLWKEWNIKDDKLNTMKSMKRSLWTVQNVKWHKNGIISNKQHSKCNQWKCLIYLAMLEFAWHLFALNRLIWNLECIIMHNAHYYQFTHHKI